MRYQKKPLIIEAFQFTDDQRKSIEGWPQWLKDASQKPFDKEGSFYCISSSFLINTLEGALVVGSNDYIIKGIKGEIYPCKPDIFEETYVRVEE